MVHNPVQPLQYVINIVEPSHVGYTVTPSTIQDGFTALENASYNGHHKVVELLLGAGANPDLQDKVRTGQDSREHVNQGCMTCIL